MKNRNRKQKRKENTFLFYIYLVTIVESSGRTQEKVGDWGTEVSQ